MELELLNEIFLRILQKVPDTCRPKWKEYGASFPGKMDPVRQRDKDRWATVLLQQFFALVSANRRQLVNFPFPRFKRKLCGPCEDCFKAKMKDLVDCWTLQFFLYISIYNSH